MSECIFNFFNFSHQAVTLVFSSHNSTAKNISPGEETSQIVPHFSDIKVLNQNKKVIYTLNTGNKNLTLSLDSLRSFRVCPGVHTSSHCSKGFVDVFILNANLPFENSTRDILIKYSKENLLLKSGSQCHILVPIKSRLEILEQPNNNFPLFGPSKNKNLYTKRRLLKSQRIVLSKGETTGEKGKQTNLDLNSNKKENKFSFLTFFFLLLFFLLLGFVLSERNTMNLFI